MPEIDFIWFLCTLSPTVLQAHLVPVLYMFIVVSILFLSFSIPYWEVSIAIEIHLGSHHLNAVLRIRDVYPGSEFFPSCIPDPNLSSRIPDLGSASKNSSILIPQLLFLTSHKYDPGCSIRIWILIFFTHPGFRIQGSKRCQIPDTDPQHC